MKGKSRDRMKKKREDEREMKRDRGDFFPTNVSEPSNPPDELAQNVSKKSPSDDLFLHFPSKVQNLAVFFIYLHDSNSFFWAQRIKSELFFGRTVLALYERESSSKARPPSACAT